LEQTCQPINWNKTILFSVYTVKKYSQGEKMKNKTFTYAIPVLLLVSLILGACQVLPSANAQNTITPSESTASQRTIAVTGTGEVILVPDMAYINVGIHTKADDVSSAVNANNQQAADMTEAIVGMGVEEKDIQTSNFNVYSMNRYDNMSNVIGTSFAVDNTLYIIVRDLPKLSEILDAALGAGANQIYGISFDIADRQAAFDNARDLAIQDAGAKAAAVADTAGVALGKIRNITVANTSYVQPLAGSGLGGGMASDSTTVPISAGQIVVTATADLIYEFSDK